MEIVPPVVYFIIILLIVIIFDFYYPPSIINVTPWHFRIFVNAYFLILFSVLMLLCIVFIEFTLNKEEMIESKKEAYKSKKDSYISRAKKTEKIY
jgi:hypothetical protein